ncbi:MAG: penicillin-binding protein 2 [Lentisphaerae bacterium]|nr:penicillin-binding protein 2 [Lentisphaerota bacterium]
MIPLLKNIRFRIIFLACLWVPILCGFIWRAYHLQITRHAELKEKARIKYSSKVKITGKRGEIFDADGNLLVANLPRISIAVSPYAAVHEAFVHYEKSRNPERRAQAPALREQRRRKLAQIFSRFFNKPFMHFYRQLEPMNRRVAKDGTVSFTKNQYLLLEREAEKTFVDQFKAAMKSAGLGRTLATFSFKNIYVRNHPKGRLAADLLGYTDIVNDKEIAKGGLESSLNVSIQSVDGLHSFERDRRGSPLSYGKQNLHDATDGKDVYLTIRENIQAILEEELDNAVAEWNPANIYAAIADPRTGDILAIAQRPTWDPTDRTTFIKNQTGMRFAIETYEPGSVFKPFFVGKALDWNVVSPSDKIDCENGSWIYARKVLSDVSRYGLLTPGEILKKSSNIGAAKIGLKMGDRKMNEVRRLFGFGQRTGLQIPRESRGLLAKIPGAKVTSSRVPIGYATSVTILQLLRGYCAVATGKLPRLNIIDRYRDTETGKDIIQPRAEPVPVFENSEAHKQLVEMLCTVTAKDGTGRRGAIAGYEVAGKTGTARKVIGRGYGEKAYFTSFAGFVPAKHPELVMVVTVDHPKGKNLGGGTVAAPIFKKTLERVLRTMLIPPDFPE